MYLLLAASEHIDKQTFGGFSFNDVGGVILSD